VLRTSLRASAVALTLLAVGCGRGGLGDFDGDGGFIDDDADEDTSITTDSNPPPFDTWWTNDTGGWEEDTAWWWDSGSFDTATTDTMISFDTFVPPDTFIGPDTMIGFDTFVPPDTFDFDTGTFDTSVEDSFDFDTGELDTGIIDTGEVDAPPEGGILCGTTYCSSATEECCANITGLQCVAKGTCTGGTLSCSSSASCGTGQVCCFGGLGGGSPTASCQFFCVGIILCATDAECSGSQRCQPAFGGYRTCR
jgi:hypothetical protein